MRELPLLGCFFFFQAEDGIPDKLVTGVQTCALPIWDVDGVPPWRRILGMVFQHYAIFPHMTVAQNVGYGLGVRRRPAVDIGEKVDRLLTLVGLARSEERRVGKEWRSRGWAYS